MIAEESRRPQVEQNRLPVQVGPLFIVGAAPTLHSLGYETYFDRPRWPIWMRTFAPFDNWYKVVSNHVLRRSGVVVNENEHAITVERPIA